MPITTHRNSLTLSAAILGGATVVILLALLLRGGETDLSGPVTARGEGSGSTAAEPVGSPTQDPPAGEEAPPARRDQPPAATPLLCLRASDGEPVAGIRLYAGLEAVAGPSGEDGVLAVPGALGGVVTVWATGWLPQELAGAELPDRVLLEEANATLEVRLRNALPGHRVQRSLLQAHTRRAREGGPWRPRLEPWGGNRWGVEGIPADTYDVYFWVSLDEGEPHPFFSPGVIAPAGEVTVVELDLAVPPAPDPDD